MDARIGSPRTENLINMEYPIFEAKPGTVISVFSAPLQSSSICGYCRGLVLEHDHLRFVGGFRRYTDRARRISWADPVEWPVTPITRVSIRIVSEKPWMQLNTRPDFQHQPEHQK
ncbi:hypothetical protein BH09VER1_BH09VER1_53120 [soil metagenome]